ncbi:unnamed protein product, partial [Lampetra planeri]
ASGWPTPHSAAFVSPRVCGLWSRHLRALLSVGGGPRLAHGVLAMLRVCPTSRVRAHVLQQGRSHLLQARLLPALLSAALRTLPLGHRCRRARDEGARRRVPRGLLHVQCVQRGPGARGAVQCCTLRPTPPLLQTPPRHSQSPITHLHTQSLSQSLNYTLSHSHTQSLTHSVTWGAV